MKVFPAIGVASGLAAADPGCAQGPLRLASSPAFSQLLASAGLQLEWEQFFSDNKGLKIEQVSALAWAGGQAVKRWVEKGVCPLIFGGDHSCAIGTWSGVAAAKHQEGPIGLIWIDAHLDAHTVQSSLSGNIHGMPVAALMGYGEPALTQVLGNFPKVLPQHLCFIGIRDYELAEKKLVEDLGVKVFYMEEVKRFGLKHVMSEAIAQVKQGTVGFGVSIDLDGMDPLDAPATGTPVKGGIVAKDLLASLSQVRDQENLLAIEIAEFDPTKMGYEETEQRIGEILLCLKGQNAQ